MIRSTGQLVESVRLPGERIMGNENRVLELLYDRGEIFFSLEALAAAAGIDRAGVDEAIKVLRRRGHGFEFSPAHGVRLIRPLGLDAHLLERGLGTRRVGRHVICFDQVDSTNDVAADSARQDGADGLAVLAEHQRRGRGRRGRQWLDQPGADILLSVLLVDAAAPDVPGHEALTIAAGLAVAEGVEIACGLKTQLEWPNDVLLDGEKLAGVLVELRRGGGGRFFVIGAGINVNAAPPAAQIDSPVTCLADHLGHPVERIELIRAVLRRLDRWVGRISAGRLGRLHSAWLSRCGMINQRIAVLCKGIRHVGRVLDVSPLEGLVLSCDDGRRVHLPAECSTVLDE